MIVKEQSIINGEVLDDKELLLLAALYHDSGRSKGASNKMHGVVGAQIARSKLSKTLDEKILDIIEFLIATHASKIDKVDFKNKEFSEKEKKNIQALSDILKKMPML